jgi:hypothetical protein
MARRTFLAGPDKETNGQIEETVSVAVRPSSETIGP